MSPRDLQAVQSTNQVPLQIERTKMQLSSGRSSLARLGRNYGNSHIVSVAELCRQPATVPVSQPISGGLAAQGMQLVDFPIDLVFKQGASLNVEGGGRTGRPGKDGNGPDCRFSASGAVKVRISTPPRGMVAWSRFWSGNWPSKDTAGAWAVSL